jgi:hypothetical protein
MIRGKGRKDFIEILDAGRGKEVKESERGATEKARKSGRTGNKD